MFAMTVHIPFDNSYARLPDRFFVRQPPVPVAAPSLLALNEPLARDLGLDPAVLASPEGIALLAGNAVPEGADPLAQAYAGHQFGGWNPQLGDGGRSCWARWWTGRASAATSSSRAPGARPSRGWATGAPGMGPVLREFRRLGSHALDGRAHDPRPLGRGDGGDDPARARLSRRRARPRGREPHPRGHLPVLLCPRRRGGAGSPHRLRDQAALSGCRGTPWGYCAGGGAAGAARRPLDGSGLHPWRDEHRQHDGLGGDHRLRSLRIHGRLPPRHGVLLHRYLRPLRLPPAAAGRRLEPRAARHRAPSVNGERRRDPRGHRGRSGLRGPLRAGVDPPLRH
jgi:hypothetical protein